MPPLYQPRMRAPRFPQWPQIPGDFRQLPMACFEGMHQGPEFHCEGKQRPRKVKLPSAGSKNHHSGQCRPCKLIATKKGCQQGAKCNFCHFEHHDEGKYLEMALHTALKHLHFGQVLPAPAEEDPEMRWNRSEDPCDKSSPAFWLGSPSESTEYSEYDPFELTHGLEDLWQTLCGWVEDLQKEPEVHEATRTTSAACGNETTDLEESWHLVLGPEPEVQSLSV
eukprot:TRINITY_DN6227_c0_g1_i1.p1 TRINITY_DN6227_c0_g1~~TRINITY_DN6227_c0_g1_i1.p1  ORF type:complete len:236 (+),score=33.95 TRINITY_DN6227_c0_g1_i1:40-708(+)